MKIYYIENNKSLEKYDNSTISVRSTLSKKVMDEIVFKNYPNMSSYKIIYNKFMKPYIMGNLFFFNISHSGKYTIIGLSEYEIGIDIQRNHDIDFTSIIDLYFSKEDKKLIDRSLDKKEKFYEIWTIREAFVKFLGIGFDELIDEYTIIGNKIMYLNKEYFFTVYKPFSNYTVSIVSNVLLDNEILFISI